VTSLLFITNLSNIEEVTFMASDASQKPPCPVCHQADQVKTTQAAYDSGVAKCAPPDMPTRKVSMLKPMAISMVLVGVCIFLIIVLVGSESLGADHLPTGYTFDLSTIFSPGFLFNPAFILCTLTLICIVGALVSSYMAFQRVVQGDAEATRLFPAWDRAMAIWKSLYYCGRDNVVFDPKTDKVIPDQQLAALRAMEEKAPEQISTTLAQSSS
jgi:hypothetical protein